MRAVRLDKCAAGGCCVFDETIFVARSYDERLFSGK